MSTPEELLRMELSLSGEDWTPTPHGALLADVLAESHLVRGKRVLELGAGSANHSIVILRQGVAHLTVTELNDELLATTRRNIEHNCPESADKVDYRAADWLHTDGTFEMLITNPPFCKSGKTNRRYFIDSLILDARKRLEPGGELLFVQSSMADVQRSLRELDRNGFTAEVIEQRQHPWREYYLDDPKFLTEADQVEGGYETRDGVRIETLSVILSKLRG